MKTRNLVAATLALCMLGLSAAPVRAEESLPALTKKIFNQYKDSVVGVSGIAKVSISAADSKTPLNIPDQDRKFEATGTVIDASGMIVVALSQIDPAKEITGRELSTPAGRVTLEASSTLKEVKIVMPDGTEIPADVVIKDTDLDLAILKPKEDAKEAKGAKFVPVDLKSPAKSELADDTVTVWRMEDIMNHQPGVIGGQVFAVTLRPRTFFRVSNAVLGCPCFAMDGKIIGIGTVRSAKEKGAVPVLIPASDVQDIADQAKAAKPIAAPAPADTAPAK